MESLIIDLFPQLGIAAVMLYLLLEERKARQALEERVMGWMDQFMSELQEIQNAAEKQ